MLRRFVLFCHISLLILGAQKPIVLRRQLEFSRSLGDATFSQCDAVAEFFL